MTVCEHKAFEAHIQVNRLEDTQRFLVELYVRCSQCKTQFRFLGLPIGVHLNGATMSHDGQVAILSIAPEGVELPEINGPVAATEMPSVIEIGSMVAEPG